MSRFFQAEAAAEGARDKSRIKTVPGPRDGWIKNAALSGDPKFKNGAEVFDNLFPTTEGCRLRRGRQKRGTCGVEPLLSFLSYDVEGEERLFVADAANIYDVTSPADPDTPIVATITGLTNGHWSGTQFSAGGGDYLIAVNGYDAMRRYDGAAWTSVTGAITGVSTAALSHVWNFKTMLMFCERGTLNAWALPALSITGAAVAIPLGAVFAKGGSLLFGGTFSVQDVGEGLDDLCVFVTTTGECAVYEGTDPSDASKWRLAGLYDIGRPLGKNAVVKVGGDLIVATADGIVTVTAVLSRDELALKLAAMTYPIEEAWRSIVRNSTGEPFALELWSDENMLAVGVPQTGFDTTFMPVANARTGRWGRYTNWDGRAIKVFEGKLFIASSDGIVYRGEVTGKDVEAPYTGICVSRFSDLGTALEKTVHRTQFRARTNQEWEPLLTVCADGDVSLPSAPSAVVDPGGSSVWDEGEWDASVWASSPIGQKLAFKEWQFTPAQGTMIAPAFQITSGRVSAPDIEIVAQDVVFELSQSAVT